MGEDFNDNNNDDKLKLAFGYLGERCACQARKAAKEAKCAGR